MTREEMHSLLSSVGTVEDDAERRNLITQITDAVNTVYDENEALTASETKLKGDNAKLQEYNMKLFLRVGEQQKPKADPEEPNESLTYEKLFNEKGELI